MYGFTTTRTGTSFEQALAKQPGSGESGPAGGV